MKEGERKKLNGLLFVWLFALLNLLTVLVFYKNVLLTTGLLLLLSIIGFIVWRVHIPLWIFLVGALCGGIAEMIAIYQGVWNYEITNILNVPSWLFVLWGNTALFFYHLAIEFERKGFHKR